MQIAKTCSHRKLDGSTCRILALSGRRYCHYHERYFDRNTTPKTKNTYALVPFEDTRSILFTINQLIYSFLNDQIEESKFTKTIYALQVAAQYANRDDALSPDAVLEQQELEKAEQEQAEKEAAQQSAADSLPAEKDPAAQLIEMFIGALDRMEETERLEAGGNQDASPRMSPEERRMDNVRRGQEHIRREEEERNRTPLPFQKT